MSGPFCNQCGYNILEGECTCPDRSHMKKVDKMNLLIWRAKARFAVRIGNLDLVSCDENLCQNKKQTRAEISQWGEGDEMRWTIAVFDPKKDGGFDLRYVGERPLDEKIDQTVFTTLVFIGFKLCKTLEHE